MPDLGTNEQRRHSRSRRGGLGEHKYERNRGEHRAQFDRCQPWYRDREQDKTPALRSWLMFGQVDTINSYFEEYPDEINHPLTCGWTPLVIASSHGHPQVIVALIELGATIDPSGTSANTCPIMAVCCSQLEDTPESDLRLSQCAALLIHSNSEIVNTVDAEGCTPVIMATRKARFLLLKLLTQCIKDKSVLDHKDCRGKTVSIVECVF